MERQTGKSVLPNYPGEFFEVVYEATMFETPRFVIGSPEN
jgi:hypothetical protein